MRQGSFRSLVSLSHWRVSPVIVQPRGPLKVSATENFPSFPHSSAFLWSDVHARSLSCAHPSFTSAIELSQVTTAPERRQPPLHVIEVNLPSAPQKMPALSLVHAYWPL